MQQNYDEIEIDLRDVIRAVFSRWWLILICILISSVTSFAITKYVITPVYNAETSLYMGKESEDLSLNLGVLQANNQLINDYSQLVKTRLVSDAVINELALNMKKSDFDERIGVNIIKDSRLFKITFESSSPVMARDVANKLAEVVVENAQEIIGVSNIRVIDSAIIPEKPDRPSLTKNVAVAAAVGVVLALGLIYLLEMMDYTFKKSEDVEKKLGLTVLGTIPRFSGEKRNMKGKKAKEEETVVEATGMLSKNLISHLDPKSLAAESYRTLRTKLHFSSVDKEIKTIVITSPTPADGKSTTGANLAVSLCQEGKKVLLIDGDLRKPKVHKYFGLANSIGLTDILSKDSSIEEAIQHISDIEGLSILVSGTIPPNPAELMGSDRMKEFIEELKASYDIIIIDTPPVVQVTDALIASDFADLILLVVAQGETNIDAAIKARKMFSDTLAPKVSVVYVKVQSGKGYGYGYGYGYYY